MADPAGTRRIAVVAGGVAGLATALDLLDQAQEHGLDLTVTVFEQASTPGGNLQTLRQDDWQLEWGPNGFLDNEPATLRLVDRLGLRDHLLRSSDATRHRFLLVDGRLREIPTSPEAFLRSKFLPARAKLRMAGELFVSPRKDLGRAAEDPATDETVDAFGRRRLGADFAEVMLDPMVKGIFGGDSRRLSLAAAFPRMVELERDYGGLFKAMFKLARKRKNKTDAAPHGVLHSFHGGMGALVGALADALDSDPRAELRLGTAVSKIAREAGAWHVAGADFTAGPFDAVVNAAPAHAAAAHLRETAPAVHAVLARIPFAPMAVIALGFDRGAVGHDLDGFGLLVPTRERRELLGALWTSSIFAGRVPDGKVLIRAMAGGADNPLVMDLDDEALATLALAELRPLLRIKGAPEMVRVIRHKRAIAQYEPGHLAGLAAVDAELAALPGLFLTGSSYRGISVNACAKEAEQVAADVLVHLETRSNTPSEAVS
ncbi:MAG: protoporphyrinogen oxidase [bacterium]|nr:protoporphyrinogen oxidase [bacterium]